MKKKNMLRAFLLMAIMPSALFAAEREGGRPGAFLRLGVGSRALGMGGAFVAVADDATATYWNPAGLAFLREPQLAGMYSALSLDRQYYFAGLAFPLGKVAGLGVSGINFGVKNFDGRDQTGAQTGAFSNNEQAVFFSGALRPFASLALGGSFKLLRHTLADRSAHGTGYDLGLRLAPASFLALGARLQNLETRRTWDTPEQTHETFSPIARAGLLLKPAAFVNLSADYEAFSSNGKWSNNALQAGAWHYGAEVFIEENLGLRAGLDDGTLALGASLSAPLNRSAFTLDYSYANDPLDNSATHRLTFVLKFGKPGPAAAETSDNGAAHEPRRTSPPRTRLLRAEVVEAATGEIMLFAARGDLLQPGMKLKLYRMLGADKLGKYLGLAEVLEVRRKYVVVQTARPLPIEVGDMLALRMMPEAREE